MISPSFDCKLDGGVGAAACLAASGGGAVAILAVAVLVVFGLSCLTSSSVNLRIFRSTHIPVIGSLSFRAQ